MDFFEHQASARRGTLVLLALLGLAVVLLVLATDVLLIAFLWGVDLVSLAPGERLAGSLSGLGEHLAAFAEPRRLAMISLVVVACVVAASLYQWMQLAAGGRKVAEALGGVRLRDGDARTVAERRLLNVVEEMAIAAGAPVPAVYLLDEDGINAFAAGHTLHDAVIGVTRGALRHLNRDQLQGVVAHEFSHILHGDMRLNLRLTALLHGILFISLAGRIALRAAGSRRHGSQRGQRGDLLLLGLGLGLWLVGSGGLLCGRLIRAAVSRQREFLADASAVQYTRNPDGLAGALKTIAAHAEGAAVRHAGAAAFSHLFFGAIEPGRWLATHPPLDIRIRRLDPTWDGQLPPDQPQADADLIAAPDAQVAPLAATARVAPAPGQAGTPGPRQLAAAGNLLAALPAPLHHAALDERRAPLLLCALLIQPEEETRDQQWQALSTSGCDAQLLADCQRAEQLTRTLDIRLRLPLLELCLPSLQALSPARRRQLATMADVLIRADQQLSLWEWVVAEIALRPLLPQRPARHAARLHTLEREALTLLGFLAHRQADPTPAFARGCAILGVDATLPPSAGSVSSFGACVQRLALLRPLEKPRLLKACLACLQSEGPLTVECGELWRALCLSLDCPMPPLLPA